MRKWENKKKSHFFFVLFFQHRPRFDIMPDIGIIATSPNKNRPRVDIVREVRHNYNHKPPKMSRKKTTIRPTGPAPDPAPPRRFWTVRKGDTNPPEIDHRNAPENPPQNHPENTPETIPKSPPENTPPEPLQILDKQSHATTPKTIPAFCWVRTGSALGPDWVRTPFFGNSTTYRHRRAITATHSNLTKTRHSSTRGPNKTPPDPARTQHRTHYETPVFIGRPSCPYSFYIKYL